MVGALHGGIQSVGNHPDQSRTRRSTRFLSASYWAGSNQDENIKIKRHIREPHRQAKWIHRVPETLSWVDRSVAPLAMVHGYRSRQAGESLGLAREEGQRGCFVVWPVNSLTSMVGPFGQISGLLGYTSLDCDVV